MKAMCLDHNQIVFYFVVLPIFLLALGAAGLVWLMVALGRHVQSETERMRSLKSYE
jgi:hypothetical protein